MAKFGKVLVTGGTGFIGSHVVDKLVAADCEVKVFDNLSTGKLSNIREPVESGRASFFEGDLRDAEAVAKSLQDVDAVVHLAAVTSVPFSFENPSLTFETNVTGTLNLLNACVEGDVKKFVFVSSCSVYGEPCYLPVDEEHLVAPASPYASSKLEGERHCVSFGERHGLNVTVLRLFNVYGLRQGFSSYSGVITQFVERFRRELPLAIFGDGCQTRDFVHVSDVVWATFEALESERANGEVFNVGFGKPTSLNDLAKTFCSLVSERLQIVYDKPRLGDVKASFADISKAEKLLGYKPKVALDAGLRALLDSSSGEN